MTANKLEETYIPYRRTDLINLCLEEGKLEGKQIKVFKEFCEILSAFYHFRFHKTLEVIKDNYIFFNPHSDVHHVLEPNLEQYEEMKVKVINSVKSVLERASYHPIPDSIIQNALGKKSLINLKTEVDFNDFEGVFCCYRGNTQKNIKVKKYWFWKTVKSIDIFERVVLLIHFKGKGYFQAKASRSKKYQDLNFLPGKIYIYFYKNIPKLDIDLLFPNLKTSMTWKDRLLFGVPALGAAIPLILKILPNLLVILAAILLILNASSLVQSMEVEPEKAENLMSVLVATLSLVLALGGFATQQYNKYKSKQLKFQKDVTDTLFFKNLANHDSAVQVLVDLAEEEECKEIILVYYHLITSSHPLTPEQLDQDIEAWLKQKTNLKINFDIHGPLNNLHEIRGKLINKKGAITKESLIPILSYDSQGCCHVLPLEKAKMIIDYVWDHAFQYNGGIL
ncbi:MAG: TMEM143 family protein [Cyanobacteria bacterium P01_G01_bin.49]